MDHGDRVRWVISESGGRYTIVQGAPADTRYMREGVLTRQANHLSGDVFVTTGAPGRAELSIGKIPTHMSLTVDLPEDVMRRLEAVAVARGVSVEELAAETLAKVAPVDGEFAETVTATIAEHGEILDRLVET